MAFEYHFVCPAFVMDRPVNNNILARECPEACRESRVGMVQPGKGMLAHDALKGYAVS